MQHFNSTNDLITNKNTACFGRVVNGRWSDAQRRIIWFLICKAREGLKIELDPVVATAFVILQKYFRNQSNPESEEEVINQYDLLTLMTAALFTACKRGEDSFRPMDSIYQELSKICINAPFQKIRSIAARGPSYARAALTQNDYDLISRCEIDLLNVIGFELGFDLPFKYFNEIIKMMTNLIPQDSMNKFCQTWLIDTCLMICSQYYLDLPPEVAAAAAVFESFQSGKLLQLIPSQHTQPQLAYSGQSCPLNTPVAIVHGDGVSQYIFNWVNQIREKHGDRLFQLAQTAMMEERQKTVPRQPSR